MNIRHVLFRVAQLSDISNTLDHKGRSDVIIPPHWSSNLVAATLLYLSYCYTS